MVSNKNALSFAERALLIYAIELPFGKLAQNNFNFVLVSQCVSRYIVAVQ